MKGEARRQEILKIIYNSDAPVSACRLADICNVSRQVIVSDIALLRAAMCPVLSTNKGYIMQKTTRKRRIFAVCHNNDQIEDELNTIVDAGGYVVDVFVKHKIYGEIHAKLNISSRLDVCRFVSRVNNEKLSPLKKLTNEYHYHTIEADSEKILDIIENRLREKNYLISDFG